MYLKIDDHVCQNCGEAFRGRGGKQRKFCAVCQAHRDIGFLGNATSTCESCKRVFYPWRTNYKLCYQCQDVRHGFEKFYPAACPGCGEHNRTAPGLERTCSACVQKTPEARRAYFNKLTEIIRGRMDPTTQEATA